MPNLASSPLHTLRTTPKLVEWPEACLASGVALVAGICLIYQPALFLALTISSSLVATLFMRPVLFASVLLAIGGIPLAFLTAGERHLMQQLGGVHAGGMLLALLLPSVLLFILGRMAIASECPPSYMGSVLVTVPLTFFALISLTYSPDISAGIRLLFKIFYPPVFGAFLLLITKSHADREILIRGFLLGGAFVGIISSVRLLHSGELSLLLQGEVIRHSSGFSHPSPFSFYMLTLFGFCYLRSRFLHSLPWLGLGMFFGLQVVLAFTRISLLCLVLTIILAEFMRSPGRLSRMRAIFLSGIVSLVFVALTFSSSVLQKRFFYTSTSVNLTIPDFLANVNDQGRLHVWEAALLDISATGACVFGKGLGASSYFLWTQEYNPHFLVMHNEYLRILYDLGILGLLLSGAAALYLFHKLRRSSAPFSEPADRFYFVVASLFLLYLFLIALTDNPLDYYMMFNQYVFFGIALAFLTPRLARSKASV